MLKALTQLDQILRGETTRLERLRKGSFELNLGPLIRVGIVLGALYGICMGAFAVVAPGGPGFMQMISSAVKVPALFLLTLVVTFPSLYVFNALIGSRLLIADVLKLLIAALGVTMAVLASLGPIEAFFAVSSTSYDFMILLNVCIFAAAGFLGLGFLLQTLHRLSLIIDFNEIPPSSAAESIPPEPLPDEPAPAEADADREAWMDADLEHFSGPLEMGHDQWLGNHVRKVFACWVVVFGLVGAQMAWLLRPFVGDPSRPFEWFRERDSNFFEAVWTCLANLFS